MWCCSLSFGVAEIKQRSNSTKDHKSKRRPDRRSPVVNIQGQATVYVYNRTREAFVATEAVVADSYVRRLVGLLGKTKRWARVGTGLWIVPSRGVHTIGMMFPIDLVFLSRDKEVVHIEEYVRPFRISRVSLKASQRIRAAPAYDLPHWDEGRGPVGDFLRGPAYRGFGTCHLCRRLVLCRPEMTNIVESSSPCAKRCYAPSSRGRNDPGLKSRSTARLDNTWRQCCSPPLQRRWF